MGYYVKYHELQNTYHSICNQMNEWNSELDDLKQKMQDVAFMQEIKGETANSIRSYILEIHIPLINFIQQVLAEYKTKMREYVNDYQKIDSNENAKISIDRLDEQITNIHTGIDSFQTIQESVSQAIGMVAGLVSVSAPSGVQITSNYERLGQKASNLKDEVGECEYDHLTSDFGNMEDMLSNILQIINRQSGKSNVTITTYQAGSISKIPAYQKLQEAASNYNAKIEEAKSKILNYREINALYWNRTDDYFTEGWVNDQLKIEEALNVIKIETIEQGSLDILNQITQLGYSPHNYRLMALIKLVQLNQGSFSMEENVTEVEDKEEWTEKFLTGLKDAKETAGEFLETTGEFLLGNLPAPFKDIVMFCGGFSDRVLTNLFPGSNFMNEPYQETLKIPYTEGVIAGDIVSMAAGVLATMAGGSLVITGGAGVVVGTAATATVVGAAPGLTLDAASIGVVIKGIAVAGVGVELTFSASKNIGKDLGRLQEVKDEIADGEENANTLTDAQKSRLNALENTINDHLTEGDFSGTLRDLQGNPVPNGKGGYFDHLGEMKDSYKSLQKIKRGLEGSLKNPNLSDIDRVLLQEGVDKANSYISKIEELFKPYGGIN